ncbi:MAG: hypothetical protein IJA58_00830, partial [Lachnospiraceae bacterium]|nr:hypothetical protein [Lachnospiraceae bacterium]
YPQFTALAADSDVLAKTNSNIKVSPSFDDISDDIIHIYKRVDEVLSPVRGAMVETRVVVQDGVVVTTYDNGWSVVVNYSTAGFTQGEITVEAKSAVSVKTEFLQMKGGN